MGWRVGVQELMEELGVEELGVEELVEVGSGGAFLADSPSHWVSPSIGTSTDEPHQLDHRAVQPSEFEPFHSPLARQTLPELQVLRETRHMSDWLSERLRLTDETLLVDPDSEFALLDEIFSKR
ncbi:MAG: hypothetical protein R3C56_17880 [Pirellulaceae bacterium]